MQMTRSEFEKLSVGAGRAFREAGGEIVDDPSSVVSEVTTLARNPMRRPDFEQLHPQEKMSFVLAGGVVVDWFSTRTHAARKLGFIVSLVNDEPWPLGADPLDRSWFAPGIYN